jgi:hypothetical protein
MDVDYSELDFAQWIADIIRCELGEDDASYIYSPRMRSGENHNFKLAKAKLSEEIQKLAEYEEVSETVISTKKTYEILVREEGPFFRMRPRENDTVVELEDSENKLHYRLIRPSNTFALYLLLKAAKVGEPRALSRPFPSHRVFEMAEEEELCVLDIMKRFLAGRLTLKIDSETTRSTAEFEKYSSAFLFNISYNTDSALVQQRDFDELLRSGRITRTRRYNMDELDPPRRFYIPDLIHHYQLAVGTENPMLEYISYYHISEHFFENVFNEELIEKVRTKITHPDFSYKRKKDISSLIKDIGKSIKMRDESMTFNELEGLRLTLKKFINLDELIEKIEAYDPSLIEYYKSTPVPFSNAPVVDLKLEDADVVIKHLGSRIYQTRNAIVHSKESEKSKYTPFRDDSKLVKEVPLLRFISEQIIFSTSTLA